MSFKACCAGCCGITLVLSFYFLLPLFTVIFGAIAAAFSIFGPIFAILIVPFTYIFSFAMKYVFHWLTWTNLYFAFWFILEYGIKAAILIVPCLFSFNKAD